MSVQDKAKVPSFATIQSVPRTVVVQTIAFLFRGRYGCRASAT